MERAPGEKGSFLARFKVDGREWPLSASAVSLPRSVQAEYKNLVTGDPFRIVRLGTGTPQRTVKRPHIRVNFDLIPYEWLKRLENLQEQNQPFEAQLITYDARYSHGVPAVCTVPFDTSVSSPTLVTAQYQYTNPGYLLETHTYAYRISCMKNGKETRPSPSTMFTIPHGSPANNTVNIQWKHIAGVQSYRIYGRTPGKEQYIDTVAANVSPDQYMTYSDTGVIVEMSSYPNNGEYSPYKTFYVANEKRWSDNADSLEIRFGFEDQNPASFSTLGFDMIDHNKVTRGTTNYGTIDTLKGTVTLLDSLRLLATQEMRVRYIWEPRVVIDEIEPNAQPGNTYQGAPGVWFSPIVTLFVLE